MSSKSKEILAIETFAQRKFHRLFTLPATDEHGSLKVSYSIAGFDVGEGDDDVKNIFWCGAMLATRYQAARMDYVAGKAGVRIIFIDRPGFGASTPVPLNERLSTFLEIIPLLLAHLDIKHIALGSHSAGTIYAFNVLAKYPELLYPSNPSISFFSPWVHQSLTSVHLLTMASMLPDGLLGQWSTVMGFIAGTAIPTIEFSGGLSQVVSQSIWKTTVPEAKKEEEERKCLDAFGVSLEVKEEVEKTGFKYVFLEDTKGLNEEARTCLKSLEGVSWGACEDFELCVKTIAEVWDRKVEAGGKPLSVGVHFPEEDMMIGDKGMLYFESIWREENSGNAGLKVEVARWKGTDHDNLPSASNKALGRMFALVNGLRSTGSETE